MTPLARVVEALGEHGCQTKGQRLWTCPGHEDHKASLSVAEGNDGRALLHCHAGCPTERVVEALGLQMVDLFHARERLELQNATYDYRDERGDLLYQVVRSDPKDFRQRRPKASGGWDWSLGDVRRVPYQLPELIQGMKAGKTIYIAEGEKDVLAFQKRGYWATCNPGGAGKWRPEFTAYFDGATAVVVADDDEPGERHALNVAASLDGVTASLHIVKAAAGKDAFDHFAVGLGVEDFVDWSPEHVEAEELGSLLDEVKSLVCRYVALKDAQVIAVTLWVITTWLVDHLEVAPYLAVTSPTKRSGKSRLFEVFTLVVRSPWFEANPTEAVTFRKIQRDTPTLLLDEADAIWNRRTAETHEGLRALLNAGHRRGAVVSRCVGPDHQLRDFAVFCLKAIAAIGKLPDTIADRAIPIRLHRRRPDQMVARFRQRDAWAETAELRGALERWAQTAGAGAIAEARPEIPEALHDRAADVWEPLLAVADAAAGEWPEHARRAALELHDREGEFEDETLGIRLLADVRTVFVDREDPPTMHTETLLEALHGMDEAPWSDLRGKPLDSRKLAGLLRPYGPRPGSVRVGQRAAKGWRREGFEDAWSRYLPRGRQEVTSQRSRGHNAAETDTCTDFAGGEVTHANLRNSSKMGDRDPVTFVAEETGNTVSSEAVDPLPCTSCGQAIACDDIIVCSGGAHHATCLPHGVES